MSSITLNVCAALAGWIAWNIIMLSVYKDKNEKTFNIKAYAEEYWDNWLASLVMIPVLLYVGYKGLGFGAIDMEHLHWSDVYYVCSGFAVELVKEAWDRYKNKQKS